MASSSTVQLSVTTSLLFLVGLASSAHHHHPHSQSYQQHSSSSANAYEIPGQLNELPHTGQQWITLDNHEGGGIEFLPADDFAQSQFDVDYLVQEHHARKLAASKNYLSGYANQFVDGAGSYYNDYAQAWRLLGFYIDCNAPFNNNNECYDEGGGGGGRDGDDGAACQRYLLWAAVSTQTEEDRRRGWFPLCVVSVG